MGNKNPSLRRKAEIKDEKSSEKTSYSEGYHLEDTEDHIVRIYSILKDAMHQLDPLLAFNPQKYYISIRKNKNFAYLDIKKKKIKLVVMLPFEEGQKIAKSHRLRKFTEGIERFYGGHSFEVIIENEEKIGEIIDLLKEAYKKQNK